MIYFLTVNYYSTALVRSMITSIQAGMSSPYELLIVNNSPEEADIHQLTNNSITVIESGDNIGFGRACNLGIEQVYRTDPTALIWLINPDATLDKGADLTVQSCFENYPDLAILGTQIRSTSGEVWFAAGEFNPWTGYINHSDRTIEASRNPSEISPTAWISGCSFILNLRQFKTCPTFDPSYFLYFEDADLCEKSIRQGYQIAIACQPLVTHQVSAIIGKNTAFMYRHYTFGRLLFLWRYATFIGFCLYFSYLIVKILGLLIKDSDQAKGRWQGITAFIRKICLNLDIQPWV